MTDSLGNILGNKKFEEPGEIGVIKKYMLDKFKTVPKIRVSEHQIVLIVSSAALAGTLRMHLHELQKLCQTDKRLIIRIG